MSVGNNVAIGRMERSSSAFSSCESGGIELREVTPTIKREALIIPIYSDGDSRLRDHVVRVEVLKGNNGRNTAALTDYSESPIPPTPSPAPQSEVSSPETIVQSDGKDLARYLGSLSGNGPVDLDVLNQLLEPISGSLPQNCCGPYLNYLCWEGVPDTNVVRLIQEKMSPQQTKKCLLAYLNSAKGMSNDDVVLELTKHMTVDDLASSQFESISNSVEIMMSAHFYLDTPDTHMVSVLSKLLIPNHKVQLLREYLLTADVPNQEVVNSLYSEMSQDQKKDCLLEYLDEKQGQGSWNVVDEKVAMTLLNGIESISEQSHKDCLVQWMTCYQTQVDSPNSDLLDRGWNLLGVSKDPIEVSKPSRKGFFSWLFK
ncbi:hypothetical protein HOH87_05885 [bacterium]|jgi:hypothetical protein|nr:hypothetical protein [bacterium]